MIRVEGEAAWESVVASMAPEDGDELRALVPVGRYELALQHRLLAAPEGEFGRPAVERTACTRPNKI